MAFEAAHQFNRSGGQVELVMLLDSKAKYPLPHVVAWQKLKKDWGPLPDLRATKPQVSLSPVVGFLFVFQ
jgi:thioesterase domain-containing protein